MWGVRQTGDTGDSIVSDPRNKSILACPKSWKIARRGDTNKVWFCTC